MASQEFLASFAADIDEAGVSRLQSVLEENRDLDLGQSHAKPGSAAPVRHREDHGGGGQSKPEAAPADTAP